MADAFAVIEEDDLYSERHRLIWRCMRRQYLEHQTYSLNSVISGLEAQGKLVEAGGLKYIQELTLAVDDPYAWQPLAKTLRDYAARRRGIAAALAATNLFADLSLTVGEAIKQAHSTLYAATSAYDKAPEAESFVNDLVEWHESPQAVRGFATGMRELDEWSGGFGNEALVCLIGYSGAGKSTLLAEWMYYLMMYGRNAYAEQPLPQPSRGLIVPTEMTKKQWQIRLTAAALASNYKTLKQGGYRDLTTLLQTADNINNLPIDYLDMELPTGQDVIAACARYNPEWVLVDGLTDMGGDPDEFTRTSDNIQALHTIMKQGRLVLFSSQMNQDSKTRSNKRPNARDGRGSPSRIWQLSTHMYTVYRPWSLVESGEIDRDDFDRYALRSMDGKYIDNPEATEIANAKDRFGGDTGKFALRAFIRRDGLHGFFPLPPEDYRKQPQYGLPEKP